MRSMKLNMVGMGLETIDFGQPIDLAQLQLATALATGNEELGDAQLQLRELQNLANHQASQIRDNVEVLLVMAKENYSFGLEALDIPQDTVSGVESARAMVFEKVKALFKGFKVTLVKLREALRSFYISFRNVFRTHQRVYDGVMRKYNRNTFCRTVELPHVVGSMFREDDSEYVTNLASQSMDRLEAYTVTFLKAADQTRDDLYSTFDSFARVTRYEQLGPIYKKIGEIRLPVISGMKVVGDYRGGKRYKDADGTGNMFGLDITQYLKQFTTVKDPEAQLVSAIFALEDSRIVVEQGNWNNIASLTNENCAAWLGVATKLMAWHDRFNPVYEEMVKQGVDADGFDYYISYTDQTLERIWNSPVAMSNQQLTLIMDYVKQSSWYLDNIYSNVLSHTGWAAQRFLGALLTTLDKGLKG